MERPAGRADSKFVRLVSPEIFLWGQYTCFLLLGDTRMRLQGALHARVPPSLEHFRLDEGGMGVCYTAVCLHWEINCLFIIVCVYFCIYDFFSFFLHIQGHSLFSLLSGNKQKR